MGRKSKLTDAQWEQIGKRLLDGGSARALGREFGVSEATIRERFATQHKKIKNVANQVVATTMALRELPISAQISAHNLASRLIAISEHLAGAAVYGAATAHRLNGIANSQVEKIDDAEPEKTIEVLKRIDALTRVANNASEIGMNLLRANKETIDSMNKPETNESELLKEIADLLPD